MVLLIARLMSEPENPITAAKIKSEKALSNMEKLADENRKKWVDEIVAKALSN